MCVNRKENGEVYENKEKRTIYRWTVPDYINSSFKQKLLASRRRLSHLLPRGEVAVSRRQ